MEGGTGCAARSKCGLGAVKCRCGGSACARIANTTLMTPAMPAAASRWPMLVLTEPSVTRRSAGRPPTTAASASQLDRVAQRRAGAVGFDVRDVVGAQCGVGQCLAHYGLLRQTARRGQHVGAAVLVHRGAANECEHRVAIGQRVAQALEHDDAATFAAHEAVGRARRRSCSGRLRLESPTSTRRWTARA